jgi:hypothetical protein
LVLCGLGFLVILGYVSVTEGWGSGTAAWLSGAFFVGAGGGLILAGRYYLLLDPDTLDQEQPVSRFGHFSVGHRRQLKVLAQTGALLSLAYFGEACLGAGWPGRWFLWPLGIGAVVLQSIASKIANPIGRSDLGWSRVPKWMRAVLEPTGRTATAALFVLGVLFCWSQWQAPSLTGSEIYYRSSRFITSGYVALLYVLEALFFAYGEVRSEHRNRSAAESSMLTVQQRVGPNGIIRTEAIMTAREEWHS